MQQNHLNTELVYTHTELASSSVLWSRILPPQPQKSPNSGAFPFLSCVKNGHFRGLTTKLRQFEIAALGMIEPPSRFLDEYACRQGHYNSRGKPIFTRFNGKYVLINTLFNTFCFPVFAQSNFSHILFYTRNTAPVTRCAVKSYIKKCLQSIHYLLVFCHLYQRTNELLMLFIF